MASADQPTPAHFPIHGVHATPEQVQRLLHDALPGSRLIDCVELPRGSSFNNRIYVLKITPPDLDQQSFAPPTQQDLILKISGFCFPPLKIANEVNCMQLAKRHCPNLPIPKVIATSTSIPKSTDEDQMPLKHDWILMERMPGERASTLSFTGFAKEIYLQEFAKVLSSLRRDIPSPGCIGTVESLNSAGEPVFSNITLNTAAKGSPWKSSIEYYQAFFQAEVDILESHVNYITNRHLAPAVRDFIRDVLPTLPWSHDPVAIDILFMHGDFCDRNILVTQTGDSERPLYISGLVDFEFAGFFPAFEEFLNLAGENIAAVPPAEDDRFSDAHRSVYEHMETNGSKTPVDGMQEHWGTAVLLRRLFDNIAPWYVRERAPGPEVDEILATVKRELETTLAKLKGSPSSSGS